MSRALTVDEAFKIISPIQVSVVELVDIIKELASHVRALETRVTELESPKHIILQTRVHESDFASKSKSSKSLLEDPHQADSSSKRLLRLYELRQTILRWYAEKCNKTLDGVVLWDLMNEIDALQQQQPPSGLHRTSKEEK